MSKGDQFRWWQYLGPWPLRPVAAGLLSALFFTAFTSGQYFGSGSAVTPSSTAGVLIGSGLSGILLGVLIWLWARFAAGVVASGWGYLIALTSTAVVMALARVSLGLFPVDNFNTQAAAFAYASVRILVLLAVVMATVGFASRRLRLQVDATSRALGMSRHHQQLVLEADERVRRQVAVLLHDRVQAGLIASCLHLQELAAAASPGDQQAFSSLIDRLERLRALDVRGAARVLGPDLGDVDLQSAIEDLAAQYEPAMTCAIEVDAELLNVGTAVPVQALLGAYRIVEQGMLNAAVHGHARNCVVRIAAAEGAVTIEVHDDGSGLPEVPEPQGLGSALINTWTEVFNGSWSLEGSDSGARLTAHLALAGA